MAVKRAKHSMCVIDKWVYAICGEEEEGPLSSIERFNARKWIATSVDEQERPGWELITVRAAGSSYSEDIEELLAPRYGVMAAPFGSNQIIILGGFSWADGYMGDAYTLDLNRDEGGEADHVLRRVITGEGRWCHKFRTIDN